MHDYMLSSVLSLEQLQQVSYLDSKLVRCIAPENKMVSGSAISITIVLKAEQPNYCL